MTEVTLFQILSSRETRATKQKELLEIYGLPVISFTMNIAGPVKNSPLIERTFKEPLALQALQRLSFTRPSAPSSKNMRSHNLI